MWNFETACIPGLLQTADYARWMFRRVTTLYATPPDVEEGVHARLQRQQALYEPGRSFRFLSFERQATRGARGNAGPTASAS